MPVGYLTPAVGVVAGILGVATALAWAWADWRRKPPEPRSGSSEK